MSVQYHAYKSMRQEVSRFLINSTIQKRQISLQRLLVTYAQMPASSQFPTASPALDRVTNMLTCFLPIVTKPPVSWAYLIQTAAMTDRCLSKYSASRICNLIRNLLRSTSTLLSIETTRPWITCRKTWFSGLCPFWFQITRLRCSTTYSRRLSRWTTICTFQSGVLKRTSTSIDSAPSRSVRMHLSKTSSR